MPGASTPRIAAVKPQPQALLGFKLKDVHGLYLGRT